MGGLDGINWATFDWGEHARQLGAIMGMGGASKPQYNSKYQSTLDNLLNDIMNKEDFSYDFNSDPLYQQYKDQYTKLGNEASMNAVANTAAMTGGYGNSYGVTAASQANQQYLTQLNNVIPELYNAAMNKYKMETENLYNKYGAVGQAEDRDYQHYRDDVSDYYTDRNFNYQVGRDNVSDSQWQKQFEYQQERDKVADTQWLANFNKTASKSSGSGKSGSSKSGSGVDDIQTVAGTSTNYNYDQAISKLYDQKSNESKISMIDTWLKNGNISEEDAISALEHYNLLDKDGNLKNKKGNTK